MDIASGLSDSESSAQTCGELYGEAYNEYLIALDSEDEELIVLVHIHLREMKKILELSLCEVILIEARCTQLYTLTKEEQKILSEDLDDSIEEVQLSQVDRTLH